MHHGQVLPIEDVEEIFYVLLIEADKRKLSSKTWPVNVVGDWVYYQNITDGLSLYKIRINGKDRTKLSNEISEHINVIDDWIYYINCDDGWRIYKINDERFLTFLLALKNYCPVASVLENCYNCVN